MPEVALQVPLLALLFASIPLCIVDIREHRLPNQFTYPAAILAFFGTLAASFSSGDWERFVMSTALNLSIAGVGIWLVYLNGFGLGDVKLLLSIVQLLGYFSPFLVLTSLTISLLTASLTGLVSVLRGRLRWKDRIAFGPFLVFGYAVCAVPLLVLPVAY